MQRSVYNDCMGDGDGQQSEGAARPVGKEAVTKAILEAAGRLFAERGFAGVSVRDIAETIRRLLEADTALIRIAPNPAAVALPDFRADPALAMRLLDWQPAIGLEAGLERTIGWAREQRAGTENAE